MNIYCYCSHDGFVGVVICVVVVHHFYPAMKVGVLSPMSSASNVAHVKCFPAYVLVYAMFFLVLLCLCLCHTPHASISFLTYTWHITHSYSIYNIYTYNITYIIIIIIKWVYTQRRSEPRGANDATIVSLLWQNKKKTHIYVYDIIYTYTSFAIIAVICGRGIKCMLC